MVYIIIFYSYRVDILRREVLGAELPLLLVPPLQQLPLGLGLEVVGEKPKRSIPAVTRTQHRTLGVALLVQLHLDGFVIRSAGTNDRKPSIVPLLLVGVPALDLAIDRRGVRPLVPTFRRS